jgi:hypothetical protein
MCETVSSAAEAELGALFRNGKEACSIQTTLEEMGHPQPPTPVETDNNTAAGVANDSIKQKQSKAVDMRFCWTRDRVRQGQFHIADPPDMMHLTALHVDHSSVSAYANEESSAVVHTFDWWV